MSATYAKRKLWSNLANLGMDDNFAYEAYYAYSVTYPGAMNSTPGRYRIRITKMPASEFLKNFSEHGDEVPEDLTVIFTVQAFLEKWVTDGWLQCLDWMGDPDTDLLQIEIELNEMFESFTTGIALGEDKVSSPFPFRPPKEKKTTKPPVPPASSGDKSGPGDFEFI